MGRRGKAQKTKDREKAQERARVSHVKDAIFGDYADVTLAFIKPIKDTRE
jgi:hypothetical protein